MCTSFNWYAIKYALCFGMIWSFLPWQRKNVACSLIGAWSRVMTLSLSLRLQGLLSYLSLSFNFKNSLNYFNNMTLVIDQLS